MSCALGLAVSLHLGLAGDYNGVHPAFNCDLNTAFPVTVGTYYNSDDKVSVYAKTRLSKKDWWLDLGLVTGYDKDVIPFVRAGYKQLFITPAYETATQRVGLVVGYEFNFN